MNIVYQRGFIQIIFIIIAILLGSGIFILTQKTAREKINPGPTPTSSSFYQTSPLPLPTPAKTPYATKKPTTNIPTTKPTTPSTTQNNTCNYDLTSATGSVKIFFQPQTGYLTSSIRGELKATAGCKVLDGRSTDTLDRTGSVSTKEVIFNSVPPGSYTIRYSFAGSWRSYQNISVSSGSLTTVNANVAGDPAPTTAPTTAPAFTPTCNGISVYPSGSNPYSVEFWGQGSYSMDYSPAGYMWDFNGDGSWDTSASGNGVNHTYTSPGIYTVKMKTVTGVWESSICQTTVAIAN